MAKVPLANGISTSRSMNFELGFGVCLETDIYKRERELELIQPHMAQKPVLRGEVGCACVAREVSAERGIWASAGVQGAWVGGCGCEAD